MGQNMRAITDNYLIIVFIVFEMSQFADFIKSDVLK